MLFSIYFKRYFREKEGSLRVAYRAWCAEVQGRFSGIKVLLPRRLLQFLKLGWQALANVWLEEGERVEAFVQRVDGFFIRLSCLFQSNIALNTQLKPIPIQGGYPFAAAVSGVQAQIVLVDGVKRHTFVGHQSAIGSGLSGRAAKKAKADFGKALGGHDDFWRFVRDRRGESFCQEHVGALLAAQHAEAHWFAYDWPRLLSLLDVEENRGLPPLDDVWWFDQLRADRRVEVMTSSSCCPTCQQQFSLIRAYLNEKGIFIPIIFYADSPFNGEQQAPVYVLKSNGCFFNTGMHCDAPSTPARAWGRARALLDEISKDFIQFNLLLHCLMPTILMDAHGLLNMLLFVSPFVYYDKPGILAALSKVSDDLAGALPPSSPGQERSALALVNDGADEGLVLEAFEKLKRQMAAFNLTGDVDEVCGDMAGLDLHEDGGGGGARQDCVVTVKVFNF